jgi:NADH:ubiquinone oxidoreductase subunit 2 (subunit N)
VLVLFALLGIFFICSSNDLITAYLSIELQSLFFYIMSIFKKNLFFLMYPEHETLFEISDCNTVKEIFIDQGLIQFALSFIFISLLFKLAIAPFHL